MRLVSIYLQLMANMRINVYIKKKQLLNKKERFAKSRTVKDSSLDLLPHRLQLRAKV